MPSDKGIKEARAYQNVMMLLKIPGSAGIFPTPGRGVGTFVDRAIPLLSNDRMICTAPY